MLVLPESFYAGEVVDVARNLLGKRLERILDGIQLSGIITETEAYRGEDDLACHARSGRTKRTAVMYGLPGRAYVYFTYGMHWCFNAVCGPSGFPAAVLIRAIQPLQGLDVISTRRAGRKPADWCSGPARLCQAFAIDGELNGAVLCDDESPLWISDAPAVPDSQVQITPRVGIERTPEPWRSKPWRFTCSVQESLYADD